MSDPAKPEQEREGASAAMAMDVSSNAAPTLPAIKTDRKSKYVDDDLESEDVDDEEALLLAIEKEKEKEEAEEAAHPHAQPKTVTEAPRILQDALKQGLVAPSDSEEEEIKQELEKKVASPVKVATKDGSAIEEEKKGDDEHTQEPHYHARVREYGINTTSKINFFSQYLPYYHNRRISLISSCPRLLNIQTLLLGTWKNYRQT
jgi:hypothetical protein